MCLCDLALKQKQLSGVGKIVKNSQGVCVLSERKWLLSVEEGRACLCRRRDGYLGASALSVGGKGLSVPVITPAPHCEICRTHLDDGAEAWPQEASFIPPDLGGPQPPSVLCPCPVFRVEEAAAQRGEPARDLGSQKSSLKGKLVKSEACRPYGRCHSYSALLSAARKLLEAMC